MKNDEKKHLILEQVLQKLDTGISLNEKLEIGMKYLSYSDGKVEDFASWSSQILEKLRCSQDQHLLKYMSLLTKIGNDYNNDNVFNAYIANLIKKELDYHGGTIDWKVGVKLLFLEKTILSQAVLNVKYNDILHIIRNKLAQSQEQLLWKDGYNSYVEKMLNNLINRFDNPNEELKGAILKGRFDKKDFGLDDTVILGEDGGMYALLNSVNQDKRKLLEAFIDRNYLKTKIVRQKENGIESIEIGKGGFGTVKLAMNLLDTSGIVGDIICIKKTDSIKKLDVKKLENGDFTPSIKKMFNSTFDDYFANDIAGLIYAPKIYDMSVVTGIRKEKTLNVTKDHQKGYLMMELIPQNTGTKVFSNPDYQKWEYQKPYILDVFDSVLKLLSKNIAMTDLKPDNTLYEKDLRKAKIIDLGGTVKIDSQEEVTKFNLSKYSYQKTEGFAAPELKGSGVVDMKKALSFAMGKIIDSIAHNTDYQDKNAINQLIQNLTHQDPTYRLSLEEARDEINGIGGDYRQHIVIEHYISKIKDRIKNNKSSIGINEDIEQTEKLFIELDVTKFDPYIYKGLKCNNLFQKIDGFLSADNKESNVLLLLARAGCGKSISLQLKFIEAIKTWKYGDTLPIYFHLANGINLDKIIEDFNKYLNTNLSIDANLKDENVHLYVDGYDEGVGSSVKKNLVQEYLGRLHANTKIIITCRSDFVSKEDEKYFAPKNGKVETYYITPINYNKEINLKQKICQYFNQYPEHKGQYSNEDYYQRIKKLKLDQEIDTGFMFKVIMYALPKVKSNESNQVGPHQIYKGYIEKYNLESTKKYKAHINNEEFGNEFYGQFYDNSYDIRELKAHINNEEFGNEFYDNSYDIQKELYIQYIQEQRQNKLETHFKDYTDKEFYNNLGKYIATQLHIHDKFRLNQDTDLFKYLGYKENTPFKYQLGLHILKKLPLKIEVKQKQENKTTKEDITIGFIHDNIKNYFLIEAIIDELQKTGKSKILSSKSIVKDIQLLKSFIKLIDESQGQTVDEVIVSLIKNTLRKAIIDTKQNKSYDAITYAANAITLLVGAKEVFSCEDLSNISIKGANIRGGLFQYTNFTNADLTDVNMINTNLTKANLTGAIMTNVNLSTYPDLIGHNHIVTNCVISHDDKIIVTCSHDKTAKIWETSTGNLIRTLEGHSAVVTSCAISLDFKLIVTTSWDCTAKIWETSTGNILKTLTDYNYFFNVGSIMLQFLNESIQERLEFEKYDRNSAIYNSLSTIFNMDSLNMLKGLQQGMNSCAISSDSKLIITASNNSTAKVWDTNTGNLLKTLSHALGVMCCAISHDDKFIVTTSGDCTAKIWETSTGNLLKTLSHALVVMRCAISHDDKFIVTTSGDCTAKIWDTNTGNLLKTLENHTQTVEGCAISFDSKLIVTASHDGTVKVWDNSTGNLLKTLAGYSELVFGCAISSDSKFIVTASGEKIVKIHHVNIDQLVQTLKDDIELGYCHFSPENKFILMSFCGPFMKNKVKILDINTGNILKTLDGVGSAAFSHDYKLIVTCSCEVAEVWDGNTGNLLRTLHYDDDDRHIWYCAFSHDDNFIVTCNTLTLKVWDAHTGNLIRTFEGHNDSVLGCAISSDSKFIVTGSLDKTAKIWDSSTGNLIRTLEGHNDGVLGCAISSDSKFIVTTSGDCTAKIWETSTGNLIRTLEGHSAVVTRCAISHDSKLIVTGSLDKTAKIWDSSTGKLLDTLKCNYYVKNCIFLPNCKFIVTCCGFGDIKFWEKKHDTWIIIKEFSGTESPLCSDEAIIENVVNLSERNSEIFQQRKARIENNPIQKELDTYRNYDKHIESYKDRFHEDLSKHLLHKMDQREVISQNVQVSLIPKILEQKKKINDGKRSKCEIFSVVSQEFDNPAIDFFNKNPDSKLLAFIQEKYGNEGVNSFINHFAGDHTQYQYDSFV